ELAPHGIAGRLHPFGNIWRKVGGIFRGGSPQNFAARKTAQHSPTHQCAALAHKMPPRCDGRFICDVRWLGPPTSPLRQDPPLKLPAHLVAFAIAVLIMAPQKGPEAKATAQVA